MTEFDEAFFDGFDDLLITFGEQVVYHPRCGGTQRPMDAIVDREPGEMYIAGEVVVPRLTIRVHNDSACGINHNEIDNGDKVEVRIKPDAPPTLQTFQVVQNSDGGVIDIAVL